MCVTPDRPRYAADDLRRFVTEVFVRLDVLQEDAWVGAETLVHADLLGIDSHSTLHIECWITRVLDRQGRHNPMGRPRRMP
jgi:LDH2 family malate/lactate/ureidoglycolate dehydrogenase